MNSIHLKFRHFTLFSICTILALTAFTSTNPTPQNSANAYLNSAVINEEVQNISLTNLALPNKDGIINGKAVTCTSSLPNPTAITGDLFIWNTQLTNLSALSQLTKIGGSLSIKFNKRLTNIEGLANLQEIKGDLIILGNYQLSNCCVLNSLITEFSPTIRGSIYISNNMNWGDCQDEWSIKRCGN